MMRLRNISRLLLNLALLGLLIFNPIFLNPVYSEIKTSSSGKSMIILADIPNRDVTGAFFDRSLEARLGDSGSLGQLLLQASRIPVATRVFAIDPMLIEEVQDLNDGFTTSDGVEVLESPNSARWLLRLALLIPRSKVIALNYGSPDLPWFSRAAPSELRVHHRLSVELLQTLLSTPIPDDLPEIVGIPARIKPSIVDRYTQMRRSIKSISQYADNATTTSYRLRIGALLNPKAPQDRILTLTRELQKRINSYQDSIRVSKGRFTLTSSNENVPITLINDFENELTIRLNIKATNSKVIVDSPEPITVEANSKVSVEVPVQVLASGQSELLITMRTQAGSKVGEQVRLPLTLTVISPLTTWITTGSGLVLLLAAIIQSMRRVRRSRRNSPASLTSVRA